MPPERRPKPNALKELSGNLGKRKLIEEPKLPPGIPDCPDHLDEIASEEWNRIAPMLATSGILKLTDRAALAGYCDIYSRWVCACKNEKRYGAVIKTKSGYVAQSPYLSIVNSCLATTRRRPPPNGGWRRATAATSRASASCCRSRRKARSA